MTKFERGAQQHIDSKRSKQTQLVYKGDLAKWLAFCKLEGVKLDDPVPEAVVKFRDQLEDRFEKPTVRRVLSALSAMYSRAGLVNPFNAQQLDRPPQDEIGVTSQFSEAEIAALFKAAPGRREQTIMRLLFDTGLRISEVLAIHTRQLSTDDHKMFLKHTVKKKGRVETVLPRTSMDAIVEWLSGPRDGFLFPGKDPRKPITASWFREQLVEIGKRAGIKKAHPHRFRATFATQALDAGIPLHEVQAAMHHADPKTTLRYDRGVRGTGVTTALAEFRKKGSK